MKQTVIIVVSLLLTMAGVGCVALSHYITPADVDKQAVGYVVDAGVAEPNEYTGFANLYKAAKLQQDVDSAHTILQFDLRKLLEADILTYTILKNVVSTNHTAAMQREQMLFSESGLLSLGLSLAGMGTLTGVLGLMRKRPGDITPQEMERGLATIKGETTEELSAKSKHLIQVVKGIDDFMRTYKDDKDIIKGLKLLCDSAQDMNTRIAVSTIKGSI